MLLENKKGIIFGALDERSIAWKVAEKVHEQGGKFVLTNAPIALRMGKINELAEKCGTTVIPADATSMEDLNNLFTQAQEQLGGKLDFVLHSIGMSPNVRKNKAYTDLNHDWFQKTLDISALSFHKTMQVAWDQDAMKDWGSILALTYIAAQEAYPFYSDMADAKATLESIGRSFGYHYGVRNKVRVNTISQSPTVTSAGSGIAGFDKFFNFAEDMSPLGNADADSCADYCVTLFSDMCRYVTMQNLFHDGGYSTTGISSKVMEKWS
ncbi:MAG: SDR family oxidoreductase [Flavobacteriales bacterium]|jgi:enoyl-[acyl-carrier protein] reductase I|nr:SDR family oxidoreductase [Flavobacteriales bacterium]NCG28839.1 SDR family oxidoreductase [Bacteroidota bacterium]MBT4704330.1 SDR family oxidoreductase [Flavobacteriales bacterium]MBT4930514.1 SDR family oxidoreductase [Flavobacteriales bacterium]MBT5131790.1 SDR family oxidoreductase [Flavobacteriales bacterium]